MTSRLAGAFPGQDPTSREDVAKTIMEILQGQEDTLGASSPTPRPMMKLPARCFRDLAPGGALFVILKRCLTRKHEGRWRRFDWQSEHKRREFVGMMVECEDDLRAKGLLGHAKIHVSSDVPAEKRAELTRAIAACGAVAAVSQYEDGVTHVVHEEDIAAAAAAAAATSDVLVLGVLGKEAHVHYKRHPGSYDAWISLSSAQANAAVGSNLTSPPPDEFEDDPNLRLGLSRRAEPAKHVIAAWLLDSARFNEYCEESDYAWEDPAVRAMRAMREAAEAATRNAMDAVAAAASAGAAEAAGPGAGASPSVLGEKRPAVDDAAGTNEETTAAKKRAFAPKSEGGETLASARLAERLGANVVRRQLTTPHACVDDAAAASAGTPRDPPGEPVVGYHGYVSVGGVMMKPPRGSTMENISRGQTPAARDAAAAVEAFAKTATTSALAEAETTIETGTGTEVRYPIPEHSGWFAWGRDEVSDFEKDALPEFFGGDGGGGGGGGARETYLKIRSTAMARFNALLSSDGASARLSFAAARKGLTCDVDACQRAYDFFNRWGLINWSPDAAATAATPAEVEPGTNAAAAAMLYRFDYRAKRRDGGGGGADDAAVGGRVCVGCDRALGGVGRVYYRCADPPKGAVVPGGGGDGAGDGPIDACVKCFTGGVLPDGVSGASFVRRTSTKESEKEDEKEAEERAGGAGGDADKENGDKENDAEKEAFMWSDQETLLMLEGLETHGENWSDVAAHVGSKTVEECVRRFVRLPIEDAFIDDLQKTKSGCGGGGGDDDAVHRPFERAPNPVMASVSFLAACAGPRVAAAAAQAALASLDDEEDAPTAPTTATTDVDGADDGEKKPPAPTDPHSLGPPPPVTEDRCRAAAAASVAAAAKRAKQLADQEAREIQKLVVVITENQTRKVELKLRFFEDLEAGLNREREQLERLKRHIADERAASAKLKREREEAEAAAAKTDEPAAA